MNLERQSFDVDEVRAGPSWAPKNWPLIDSYVIRPPRSTRSRCRSRSRRPRRRRGPSSNAEVERAADDSICAMMLIRTYRVRGHLAATLDPLGSPTAKAGRFTPEYHGFVGATKTARFSSAAMGLEKATIREVSILQANYCGHVGLEYMADRRCRGAPLPRADGRRRQGRSTSPPTARRRSSR